MILRYVLPFLLILCSSPFLVSQEISDEEMIQGAKERTYILQNAIEQVIEYGKKGFDPEKLIHDALMPNFLPDATIETASVSADGTVKINDPILYEDYFMNLWQKARVSPSLKIQFSDKLDFVRIDKYHYKVVIRFYQEYDNKRYSDVTVKDVIIQYFPRKGAYVAKIGNATVFSARRR